MARFLVGLLMYLFPMKTVAQMLVILLRKLASKTTNTVDDQLVDVVAKGLGVQDE